MTMNAQTEQQNQLQRLWGAVALPFAEAPQKPWTHPAFEKALKRLQQLVGVQASGLLHGPNGVGKSLLVDTFLKSLSEKQFRCLLLTHSTLTGSDLLRALCHALQITPQMRRSDNVAHIQQALGEGRSPWPVLVLEEGQNLSASALEEIRLLTAAHSLAQAPFSLLLVGDENLLPKLSLRIHRPLLSRLGFRLELRPLSPQESATYLCTRLKEASVHQNPFEEAAQNLLLQASGGIPRLINHLAQRTFELAAENSSPTLTAEHVQAVLDQLHWLPNLSHA